MSVLPNQRAESRAIEVKAGSCTEGGGKEYICPMRSISISRSRTVRVLHQWNESFGVYGPFETMVNDVTFGDYHIFRSTSRILSSMEAAP